MPLCIADIKEQMLFHRVNEKLYVHKLHAYHQVFLDFIYMPSYLPTYLVQHGLSPL